MALAFDETSSAALRRHLARRDRLFSSNLLEAELRAALTREGVPWSADLVASIDWVLPARTLGDEIERALRGGYLRGADLWHVACALYLESEVGSIEFISLDERQRAVAAEAGMPAPGF